MSETRSDLERIEARILELHEQISKLENAAEVIRQLHGIEPTNATHIAFRMQPDAAARRSNTTEPIITNSAKVAERVLLAHDRRRKGIYYRDIAARAREDGWEGSDITIRRRMNKRRDVFESLGNGLYRLRRNS